MKLTSFLKYIIPLYIVFTFFIWLAGYFEIGLLSDDYLNFSDANNSTLSEKFEGRLAFTSSRHFRPFYYLSLQKSSWLHDSLGYPYDDFIIYRIQNLLLLLSVSFTAGLLVFLKTNKLKIALAISAVIIIFPNNLHNICWTAARVDLTCALFFTLTIFTAFLYIEGRQAFTFFLSIVFLILGLLTKETAITIPPVVLLLALFNYNKDIIKKRSVIFIIQFSILLIYLLYRFYFIDGHGFTLPHGDLWSNTAGVSARALISLSVPVDYLSLFNGLRDKDPLLIIYMIVLLSAVIFLSLFITRRKAFMYIFQIFILGFVLLLPNIFAGYIRPQMILVPFTVLLIHTFLQFHQHKENANHFNRKLGIVLYFTGTLIWAVWGYSTIADWKFGYDRGKENLLPLLEVKMDPGKQIVVAGSPGRFKQTLLFDKLTGAYNFWKYKSFSVKDTINDIVQTGALDRKSLLSKLQYTTVSPDEFEISATGETQFFYIEGFDFDRMKQGFRNKDIAVDFYDFDGFSKPRKFRLKILSERVACYLPAGNEMIKLY